MLILWEKYSDKLVEANNRVDSSHKKTATLKGKTLVNYLRRDFQLLGLVKTLFHPMLNYVGLANIKIAYHVFFHAPLPSPMLWQRCD